MSSSSPPSSDPTAVFSVRIVSLDYYLSPPIPDLDFCYSDFQGRKVEEVPIIRIYGSTPAGQKACLHVHRALPYLYIPYPDDLLHNPEEGHSYLRILSHAIEKALSHKSTASKRQHVHGCSLVRAKTIYGYHSSEDLYIKIYLYYPHDVARAASLLLGGSILDRIFQPYESHIPYLLQFLVDHNLYGMSHIHTSKYKFRPPIPDGFVSKKACYKKDDMLADSSSEAVGNPAIWLSSTVPSALIWSDSSTGHDDLDDKKTHLIRRQGICGLELDSSIDDILNVKYKLYTSLSQTGSDVKVVQSLIPIWEEEYERSGMQEAVKSPDSSKPQPEDVLKSFLHGLEYENALSELCLVAQKYFPSKSSAIEDDEKLNKYVKLISDIGKGLMEHQRLSSSCGECLKCPEDNKQVCLSPGLLSEENVHSRPCEKICEFHELASVGKMSLSETIGTEEPKGLDNEALGLLSWLASSQAVDDLSFDDELVHEAVLSPLLPTKSYKKALEMAHLDYEIASQQECQDILDSVELLKSEGLKEQISFTGGHENMDSASSGNVIPQVDGSFDDKFKTPQKEEFSEIKLNSGRERPSVHLVGKCTSKIFDCEKNKIIWGPLPISIKQKEHGDFEPTSVNRTDIETENVSKSNYSTGSKERSYDTLKVDAGAETSSEKLGKMSACSVRDLMRRKRYFRTEQSESERHNLLCDGQKDEMVAYCPEKPTHHSFEIERPYVMPGEPPHSNSLIDYDGVVQESMTCALCTQVVCTEGYCLGPTDKCLQPNIILNEHLGFHRGPSDGEYKDMSTGFQKFAVTGPPVAQSESINLCKLCKIGHLDNATGCHNNMSDASRSCLKCASCEISRCKEELSAGYKPRVCEMENVGNIDGYLKSNFCGDHFVDECSKDGRVVQQKFSGRHFDDLRESSSALDVSNLLIKNRLSEEFDMGTSSSNPECRILSDSQKQKNPLDYIEMTLSRKPPSRDEVGRISEDFPGISGRVGISDICDDSLAIGRAFIHSDGQGFNDYLPYFVKNSEDGQPSNSSFNAENLNSYRESALGVPSHFQNDGSVLYLLSHAFSPPTLDCVRQWLLEEVQQNCLNGAAGVYKEIIPSSPLSSDPSPEYNTGLGATGCYRTPDSTRAPGLKPEKLPSQENSKSAKAEYNFHVDTVSSEPRLGDVHVKEYVVANNWHDLSQISGPDEKSNLTPLSQIGFRDPASVGGGQQLTLISMEILAESREDLRPDPQFDAINIISLAIQEDTSHDFEVYVLMRGNSEELCGRNVDGISDCKFVIASEEKHLLDYCVKLISSFDPDILMGWEIQGDSLGFLAERAAHLGIGLLKKISRVPQYEAKYRFRDQGNLKSHNVDNEPSITDTVFEDAIIEDEWGRTHASGVHVDGRIVLNVWRLMRSEVKLNMYTVEAVAEEVLRRKIPSISCKVLNHWYSSGPERARYRCIEYVIERAKLNIQIMNQLDLINRTSELARIFGIDFFSVLSRGSQFRVESMLLRLAHTQNYLALSPGRQQVRKGVLPRLLEEILSTRIMIKQAMKKLTPAQQVLQRIFNARQLALKLIANVTYGYTAAGFSGRMPCAELADSIVQCGRRTLETAISFVNEHNKWKARVIYGDTDSMFVLLKGRTVEEAFRIGNEIASSITAMNPNPVTLKMEKVYLPCFLLTKKRYVGYSYECPDQNKPTFDAKGIETVRRDTCPAVAKTLEQSIRLMFEHRDIYRVKSYLQRQWTRILSGKVSLQDFVFAKEVRLGTYSARASSLPPAAIVATKAMRLDPRAEPRYGERVPYVVIHGEPGSRLIDMVVDPLDLLDINSPYRLNDFYYINKQIIPALQRVFGLLGVDLNQWFSEMPRPVRPTLAKRHSSVSHSGSLHEYDDKRLGISKKAQAKRRRIDTYYVSKHCTICGGLVQASSYLCDKCSKMQPLVATTVVGRTSRLEREIQNLAAICRHCGGGDWIIESGVKCTSLACSVFYERRKVQKELQALSSFATETGFYPSCMTEWF